MTNISLKKTNSSDQAGITLLLAVLVLAAITAIAFSLAAIITIEIRSSGDVMRTEPALYAVQAVTEEAFFKYKRFVSDGALDITNCTPDYLDVCQINGVSLVQPKPSLRQFDPAPRVDVVPPNTVPSNAIKNYLFIDPNSPNDFTRAYQSISITQLNSVAAPIVTISRCCDGNGNPVTVASPSLSPNLKYTWTISDDGQYEMSVQNQSSTSLLIQLDATKTVAVNGQTRLLPLLDKTMDISASYLGLTRKYTVRIPQP